MSCKKFTKQLLVIYKCIKDANDWVSVQQIMENTNLQKGTVGRHVKFLAEASVIERLDELNFYLYRPSNEASEIKDQIERLLTISI